MDNGVVLQRGLLLLLLLPASALAACSNGESQADPDPTALAQSRTQVERYLNLIDNGLAERLRDMPWVLDGSEESKEFVSALTNLEQSALFPGREQHQADISEVLDIVQAADWYTEDLPAEKRLLIASLFELYADGYRAVRRACPIRSIRAKHG